MQRIIDAKRLVLGTAQLGLDYGVANVTGKPDAQSVFALLDEVWKAGVRWFDTAQAYGESESLLGQYLTERDSVGQANIVTKPPPDLAMTDAEGLAKAFRDSLARTGVDHFAGIMLHRESFLDEWEGCRKYFESLKTAGVVESVGVSVYSPQRALEALRLEGVDMIQVPANILDNRFRKHGVFDLASELGKIVYIRSVYLQGLFFATPESFEHRESRLQFLDRDRALFWIDQLNVLAQEIGMPLAHLTLAYVKEAYPEARVLLGMETVAQARQNLEAWNSSLPSGVVETVAERFSAVEDEIVHPPYWRRGSLY